MRPSKANRNRIMLYVCSRCEVLIEVTPGSTRSLVNVSWSRDSGSWRFPDSRQPLAAVAPRILITNDSPLPPDLE